jgi:phosphoadenosine phosphosulfate reductase
MNTIDNKEVELLRHLHAVARDHTSAVLASSLGAEDMLLTDFIDRHGLAIEILTLDTGRLPQETYDLVEQMRRRYRVPLTVYAPEAEAVEKYTATHGPNAFYESVMRRRECCYIRKVKPLKRALAGRSAWITGQRREQSPTRQDLPFEEWDAENGLRKFNPLADWSGEEVWAYIRRHSVPTNALHDAGYASIGCAPCTRAIRPGEDERAGRWWWEEPEQKECGLHVHGQSS